MARDPRRGVDRGAFARVWADAGRYVFELSVASADGTGPFFARGSSGAEDLYAVVERLTREAVPAPNVWDAAAAARYRAPVASAGPADSPLAGQLATPSPSPTGARTPSSARSLLARRAPQTPRVGACSSPCTR